MSIWMEPLLERFQRFEVSLSGLASMSVRKIPQRLSGLGADNLPTLKTMGLGAR